MKHGELKRLVENRLEKINQSWNGIIKDFDMDEIHDFRVEVKKLRALIRLAAAQLSEELKMPIHLKTMYHHAGMIRNLQLQQQRVSEYTKEREILQPHQYLKSLSDEKHEWERKVNEISDDETLEKEERALIKVLSFTLKRGSIKSYVKGKAEELKTLIAFGEHTDEQLHKIRKILKDILYIQPYTGDYFFSLFKGLLESKEKLKSFTEKLGEFQDLCIAVQFLSFDIRKIITNPEEIQLLQTIKDEWSKKKSDLKAVICEDLNQLLTE